MREKKFTHFFWRTKMELKVIFSITFAKCSATKKGKLVWEETWRRVMAWWNTHEVAHPPPSSPRVRWKPKFIATAEPLPELRVFLVLLQLIVGFCPLCGNHCLELYNMVFLLAQAICTSQRFSAAVFPINFLCFEDNAADFVSVIQLIRHEKNSLYVWKKYQTHSTY